MSSAADHQKRPEGSGFPAEFWVDVGGLYLPKAFEIDRPLKEHVQRLQSLEMRPDDVLVLAFPKAGTHWTWEMASMLLAGKAEPEKRRKIKAMLEAIRLEEIPPKPSPRLLNTHLPPRLLNEGQVKDKGVKVVHVYRNAKDVVASGYFHLLQMTGDGISVEDTLRALFSEDVPGPKYVKYMREMDEWRKANPEVPFFLMSYEDAKEDPERVLRQLAEFLGMEASPQLIKDIAEATSIHRMKEANKQKPTHDDFKLEIFRKGEVGDWKNHLTVAQSERLDEEVKALESCDYHFRYT